MKTLKECSCQIPEEKIIEYISLPVSLFGNRQLFATTAAGNGMNDFGIDDGDRLFFYRDQEPTPGDVVMVSVNGCDPIVRQVVIDNANDTYVFHASGLETREDVISASPAIMGVLAFVLKQPRRLGSFMC